MFALLAKCRRIRVHIPSKKLYFHACFVPVSDQRSTIVSIKTFKLKKDKSPLVAYSVFCHLCTPSSLSKNLLRWEITKLRDLSACTSPWEPSDPAFLQAISLSYWYIRILRRFHSAIILNVIKSYSILFRNLICPKTAPAVHNKFSNTISANLMTSVASKIRQRQFI